MDLRLQIIIPYVQLLSGPLFHYNRWADHRSPVRLPAYLCPFFVVNNKLHLSFPGKLSVLNVL